MSSFEESPPTMPSPTPPSPASPPPAARPAPGPPAPEPRPHRPYLPIILAVLFVAAVAAAFVIERTLRSTPAAGSTTDNDARAKATGPAAGSSPAPPAATAEEVKALRDRVDELARRIDAMPKPEPPPDLAPIREQLDELTKTAGDASKKADAAASSASDNGKAIDALRSDVDALKADVGGLKSRPAPANAPEARPAAATDRVDASALSSAEKLFREGKYAEARDAFRKLPSDDARVLYYDALATGFASNKWDGEAADLATKGAQAEKAGNPSKAVVDAALGGLTDAQGRKWLDFYRAKAR